MCIGCDVKMEVSLQSYGDDDHAWIQNWFSIKVATIGIILLGHDYSIIKRLVARNPYMLRTGQTLYQPQASHVII